MSINCTRCFSAQRICAESVKLPQWKREKKIGTIESQEVKTNKVGYISCGVLEEESSSNVFLAAAQEWD